MSEITDFRKGVRAIYDYLLCRAANHFHGHEDVQKQCDYDNELVTSLAEDALESVSPEDHNEWLSITEQADRITSLESHNRELLAVNQVLREALINVRDNVYNADQAEVVAFNALNAAGTSTLVQVGSIVPCYVPAGKRAALFTGFDTLDINTKLFTIQTKSNTE